MVKEEGFMVIVSKQKFLNSKSGEYRTAQKLCKILRTLPGPANPKYETDKFDIS